MPLSTVSDRTFLVAATCPWNSLPQHDCNLDTLSTSLQSTSEDHLSLSYAVCKVSAQ